MAANGGFLEHVNAGDSLKISAATWNALIDGAKSNREGRRSDRTSSSSSRQVNQFAPQLIRVSNTASGSTDLTRFSVVALGPPVITTDQYEYLPTAIALPPGAASAWGDTPDAGVLGLQTFAVLLEPIPAGVMGFAAVCGAVKVFLDGSASAGDFCGPTLGDTSIMTVAADGRYPIISVDPHDEDNDQYPALIVLSEARTPPDHFWAQILGTAKCCTGDDNHTAFRWKPSTPEPCCEWDDSADEESTPGCVPVVTTISSGDGVSTAASWTLAFANGPPTFGTFETGLDGEPYGPFQFDASAGTLQLGMPNVTVTLAAGVYTITSTNFDPRSLGAVGIDLEPLSQHLACELNNNTYTEFPFHVLMWNGPGRDASIAVSKTDADDETGVVWVVTLSNTIGGSFPLTLDGHAISDIRWNAPAGDLQAAINAAISPSTCTVTGDGGPWTITITSDTDDHDLTADDASGLFGNKNWLFWPDTAGGGGGGGDGWTPINLVDGGSPFDASHKVICLCQSQFGGDVEINLPASPTAGMQVRVVMVDPPITTGDVVVHGNGTNIQGSPADYTLSTPFVVKEFVCGDPTGGGWCICG